MCEWVTLTRRTNDPKLAWLQKQLAKRGVESRRNGESFHAPILQVRKFCFEDAWKVLDPVDDLPDDTIEGLLDEMLEKGIYE
jgi:hypothetical protein